MSRIVGIVVWFVAAFTLRAAQPIVAVHDSELTRALETIPAGSTAPNTAGTTGYQWWLTQYHYFVMPESVKEALRSDGTPFTVVSDSNIGSGALLDSTGAPKYPILISLASEAIADSEIQPLLDYVNAGGTLFVGSSAFTRKPDGTSRGDFAIANAMGVHMTTGSLANWNANYTFSNQINHRLVSHIPSGSLTWRMPMSADEINWGTSPSHNSSNPHLTWNVKAADAQVVANADSYPYLLVKNYGKGRFIYHAGLQPLIGHGGWAPGMYSYGIFREAIQWSFESLGMPLPRLSPWPFPYDAALNVRHDFENYQSSISAIESSAQAEYVLGAKGDYYFCTGALRVDMGNPSSVVASLQRAVTNYKASIGPHNGGLPNPNNPSLTNANYDYWHWGPDEALDVTPTGYANGKAYALTSVGNSFLDVEGWLAGTNNANGLRIWVSPYFNSTREDSYDILQQLGVATAGEQKLSPFPHWTLSTRTSGKRYSFLTLPVSDWYVGTSIGQSMEYHTIVTMQAAVDYYYNLGALVNIYGHSLSTTSLQNNYVSYSMAKPRIWAANATDVYSWWNKRSSAQVTPSLGANGSQIVETFSITGATDPQIAVDAWIPQPTFTGLEVRRNGVLATSDQFRVNGQKVRVLVGNTTNTVEIRYTAQAVALNDAYTTNAGQTLTVPAPGVLGNDTSSIPGNSLTAVLVNAPPKGTLNLSTNGGFTYTPLTGFSGTDSFTYMANDGMTNSAPATVTITVTGTGNQPPSVIIISPTNGAFFAPPATITLTASASDIDGTIAKVEFYNGATLLATDTSSPYTVTFTGVPVGTYTVTARAYDNLGASATSAPVTVTVSTNKPPTVSLTSPANGAIYTAPASVVLTATASDSDGTVSKVEFYNGTTLLATDTSSPYTFTWGSVASGSYALTAKAYDNTGASTVSNAVNITVSPPPNQPPTVGLTSPTNGAIYTAPANVVLTATASDSDGTVSKVEFYNGSTLLATDTAAPYTFTWGSVASGTYALTAKAYDNSGASTISGTVNITVSPPPNQPPTVGLTSPTNGAIYTAPASVALTATASDSDGTVSKVEFYNGSTLLATDTTAPYTFTWGSVASGTYSLTAKAYDNTGASTTSGTVTISVTGPTPLFSDDFSQNVLSPWNPVLGTWTVSGGIMQGSSSVKNYAFASYSATWTDYTLQGRVQFPSGSFGGGLGGRLNASNGAHYGIWIYPEGSSGGSAVMKLVKFRTWTTWSGTAMKQVSLPSVGTGWHTITATFKGSQITVSYDGTQMMNLTDSNFDGRPAYTSGGITAGLWTDSATYKMNVDDILVTP